MSGAGWREGGGAWVDFGLVWDVDVAKVRAWDGMGWRERWAQKCARVGFGVGLGRRCGQGACVGGGFGVTFIALVKS